MNKIGRARAGWVMFEVGKRYRFTIIEGTTDGLEDIEQIWTVVAVEGTLLKLEMKAPVDTVMGPGFPREMILNTGSFFFVGATPA